MKEVIGSLPRNAKVRHNGLLTQARKGPKTSQCWKFEVGHPETKRDCRFLK